MTAYPTSIQTSNPLEARPGREEENAQSYSLLIIKVIVLVLIALFVCAGAVLSKVSLVSVTGRMFDLSRQPDGHTRPRSALFIQLTLLLVIPEVVSFVSCLVRGVIGKTTKTFPWPNKWALLWGFLTSTIEVFTLCAFIFGVACKLPPSLTILVLNGCFCFPICRYLIYKVKNRSQLANHQNGYQNIENQQHVAPEENAHGQQPSKRYLKYLLTVLESFAFLLQLGALIGIPIVLSISNSPSGSVKHYIVATYILLPVSLCIISFVWSGWIQKEVMKSSDDNVTARYKTGMIWSGFRILIIPFVSYGYAVLLLDLQPNLDSKSFDWNDLELSTFLVHVIVSYLTYFIAWIACALQSWTFFVPMLLSTPVAFVWYVGSVQIHEAFPFTGEYYVDWTLKYFVLIVASLLWISQVLVFAYYIFQKSNNVLTTDADLFWTPRYNSVFLEQQLLLNRKISISGSDAIKSKRNITRQNYSRGSVIFICSTMYHESELEMKQMLRSIDRMARAEIHRDRNHSFESHIFFDGACSGKQLNDWAIQLLGLLHSTLGIKPDSKPKVFTPYGIQLKYRLPGEMPFFIHLKDNNKVKNKKRWSQVMYMKYVLDYRIKQDTRFVDEDLKKKAFILTTDADINFTSGSVIALLDILTRDDGIGAVCARTHPQGSGPVVWYQIFDYAIGHWFQKAAEHVLGCVLCCPGCFSVFRVSALDSVLDTSTSKTVLDTYSSGVENGFDFLTKDMGEDRWLCTLLIEAGWRLEYCAISQDSTYCPETFEEFYKQRRRWIPSTIANLAIVIGNWYQITSNNDSITIMFMLYEFLIVFSSLISPATVILIIVTGIKAIDENVDEIALIIVLSIVSVLYGVICIYATEKTQLGIAKFLTIVFSIIMAVVISGILSSIINNPIKAEEERRHGNNSNHHYQFPVDVSTIYTGIFAVTFVTAGLLHFSEFFYLFHFIWYLLCLPSGYLFLIIYSVCNLNNRSWGTREGARPQSHSDSKGWVDYFLDKWYSFRDFLKKWIIRKWRTQNKDTSSNENSKADEDNINNPFIPYLELDEDVKIWLHEHKCDKMYAEQFEKEGYTKLDFIAMMKMEDFKAIGIKKRGFLLKLEKEVKKLPTPTFKTNVPKSVSQWLKSLNLKEYEELFESEGYFSGEDVENLKGLTREDLTDMGITKRAHLNQLTTGLHYLQYPTALDIRINTTRTIMESAVEVNLVEIEDNEVAIGTTENKFWTDLVDTTLKPESANLGKIDELKEKLKNLRTLSVLLILLINIMWIVFLYTLVFPQLTKYSLPDRAFSLLFLIIFSIIVMIQFVAMIIHRLETLLHFLAGIKRRDSIVDKWDGNTDFMEVTYARSRL